MNRLQSLLRETFRQGDTHHVPKVGAELCFTPASRSLYEPFLVLLLLSMLVEGTAAKAQIVGQCRNFVRNEGSEWMEMILTLTAAERAGIFGALTGVLARLIGASGVVGELQDSLNQIWGVSSKHRPVFILVKERVISFAMVFVIGFRMLASPVSTLHGLSAMP